MRPLAAFDGTGPAAHVLAIHTDQVLRPVLMTDATAAVAWRARFRPFGELISVTGPKSLDARFPGQWFQFEAGLHANWHRNYDPTLGRYLEADPLGFPDGPNRYAYVGSSPLMDVDPTGEFIPQLVGFGIGAGLELLTNSCASVSDVLVAGALGAIGGGISKGIFLRLGARSLTRETGLEWSHGIAKRTLKRYTSGGLKKALNRRGGLNGSWRTPESHARHDASRKVRGVEPLPAPLAAADRIPDWLKATGIGGIVGAAIAGGSCECR